MISVPLPAEPVRHLVVVLREQHEGARRERARRGAAALPLPAVALSLVEEPVPHARDQLARRAAVVGEVGLAPARADGDARAVMEVVVPEAVEPEATGLQRREAADLLRLVLGDEDDVSAGGRRPHTCR